MKGLLLKDVLALKKQGKVYFLILGFYLVFSVATENTSMLGGMIILLCVMMPITTLSYDEYCKWDKYALSMPIARKTVVLSKYLFGILITLAGTVLATVFSVLIVLLTKQTGIIEALLVPVAIGAVAILFLSCILPILIKFGVEKGRMLMMLVIFIPTMLVMIIPKPKLVEPSKQMLTLMIGCIPVIIIVILLLSIKLSIAIYNKKEF